MDGGINRQGARFVPVELKGRQEVYVFERRNMPAGQQAQRSFSKSLDAHDPGQHWCAVNLMIVQKGLNGRVEGRFNGDTAIKSYACQLANHRSSCRKVLRSFERGWIHTASHIPLV